MPRRDRRSYGGREVLRRLALVLMLSTPARAEGETHAASPPPRPPPGAYEFQPGAICPFCALTPDFPHGKQGLHWHEHWQPVGVREYVTVPALFAATLAMEVAIPRPTKPKWVSPILFDNAVRNALRLDDPAKRETAVTISDTLFVWEVLHPTLIDPLIAAWWLRESPRVAWQMFVINAQAYALTGLLYDGAKRLTRRARPWAVERDCPTHPDRAGCSAGSRYRSFYSGHAATTATGAGLLCAHHTQLLLYRNDVLDTGTCVVALLGTAVTGAMRIASDNHWASDVLMGHLMGLASGYLLPTLLYYRTFSATPHEHTPDAPVVAALPLARPGALGLSLFGLF